MLAATMAALGQNPQPPADSNTAAEVSTHETPATFRTKVNLVLVPVVVRDKNGHAIGNLKKEDFQLFDKGKVQPISSFNIETVESQSANLPAAPPEASAKGTEEQAPLNPSVMPNRFVAYLFDDVHTTQGDLMPVRNAAEKHMNTSLVATDRAAIFTTSGRVTQDFTDDRDKLHAALLNLQAHPIARPTMQECPDISYYQADLIVNKNDPNALLAAQTDTLSCMLFDPTDTSSVSMAVTLARSQAARVLNSGDMETRTALEKINQVIHRISSMPGKRSIVLISPGFLTFFDMQDTKDALIDRAIRANVVISALNARGLFGVTPFGNAGDPSPQSVLGVNLRSQYLTAAALADEDVLSEFSYGTGGIFFHDNNDLVEGFNRAAARPEFVYVLGFSPQNLKLDGRFHALKIVLTNPNRLELQARRGYYAPQHLADEAETARQEIQDALFSREELRDIPVELHTQFFKPSVENARLNVLAHVDVRHLRFRKENGRNADSLTVVSGAFDRNGNFINGSSKTVDMRLKDQTLESKLGGGITVKSTFDVRPGSYLIRLVVRDSEGQFMAAANGTIDIPMN